MAEDGRILPKPVAELSVFAIDYTQTEVYRDYENKQWHWFMK
jgi:hypothetical protein